MTKAEQAERGERQPLERRAGSPALGPFSEDRARIERITSRLDVTDDLIERADLGSELVRAVSRYEDTFERTLLPRDARVRPGPLTGFGQGSGRSSGHDG